MGYGVHQLWGCASPTQRQESHVPVVSGGENNTFGGRASGILRALLSREGTNLALESGALALEKIRKQPELCTPSLPQEIRLGRVCSEGRLPATPTLQLFAPFARLWMLPRDSGR